MSGSRPNSRPSESILKWYCKIYFIYVLSENQTIPYTFWFLLRGEWIVDYMVTLIKSYNSPSLILRVMIKSWWLTYKLPTLYWKLTIFSHFRGQSIQNWRLFAWDSWPTWGSLSCVKVDIEQCIRKGTFNPPVGRGQKRLHKGNILSKGRRVL